MDLYDMVGGPRGQWSDWKRGAEEQKCCDLQPAWGGVKEQAKSEQRSQLEVWDTAKKPRRVGEIN